jgi:hypothetical protein
MNNSDYVSEEFLQMIIAQTGMDSSSKKPVELKDCGIMYQDHSSMCFYLCVFDAIRNTVDSSFIQNALDLKKFVFGLEDFTRNANLKGQKVTIDEIKIVCEILNLRIYVYSPNGNDPYFCDQYGSTGQLVNLWLSDGHYQRIIRF